MIHHGKKGASYVDRRKEKGTRRGRQTADRDIHAGLP